jgi:hypothetical protein
VGVTADGRPYTGPARGTSLSNAAEIELATKALEGGLGSLSASEQAYQGMLMGGDRARLGVKPITDYLGDTVLSSVVEGAAGVAGNIAGGIGGGTAAMITSDEPDPDTLGGRIAGLMPAEDYLEKLGFNIMDQKGLDNLQSATALGRPAGVTPTISLTSLSIPGQSTSPQTGVQDGEAEYLRRQEEAVRAMGAADPSGAVYFDEETGEYRPGLSPEIQQLIDKANRDKELAAADELQRAGVTDEDLQTEKETATTDDSSPTGSTREERTNTDPAANMTVPQPKPKNFAEIVAQAKAANASEGIPSQENDQQEIQTAAERGTGSTEDIKADFLKLLPKYEEDPSVMGLNLALMGFTIAGGEDSSALKNISDGMKKTLPNFIKSAQKKKAFEREADLLASKYTIQRLEGDRKADRTKSTYFVTSPFTGPDGVEYKEGIVRLNDKAFDVLQKAGLTGNLTTQSVLTAQIAEATSGLKLTDISKLYDSDTREAFGVKYRINVPNASGLAANKTNSFVTENEFEAVTQGYVNSLEKFRALDKGLQEALDIADEGRVSGPEGFFDRVVDASIAATPASVLERFGIDKGEQLLSSANKFTRQHAVLSMQLAPLILGEAGKTISDADRVRVAQALGFSVSDSQPGVEGAGVQIAGPIQGFFTSEAQIKEALGQIQGVIRNRTEEQHREYQGFLKSANIPLGDAPKLPEVKSAFAGQGVAGITTGGLNYQIIDAPEDADYDLEIKFGD